MRTRTSGWKILLTACLLAGTWFFLPAASPAGSSHDLPVKDTVTMVDLGAKSCVPCKMMEPILKELTAEYQGRAAIVFIDVWQERDMARRFGIQAIPTQIFYDRHGKEVYRHTGFFPKQDIKKWIDRLLEQS
ncbi:MAG: hypothetical protein BWK76_04695 [Desulfobulbaceae bacterium A2]|nr:MAG: hypothetical protein BWK76_04695 [Desulfobulbaceae bacterium A2]